MLYLHALYIWVTPVLHVSIQHLLLQLLHNEGVLAGRQGLATHLPGAKRGV